MIFTNEKRVEIFNAFLANLIEIDKKAIDQDVSVKFLLSNFWNITGSDAGLTGNNIEVKENLTELSDFVVLIDDEIVVDTETTHKYRNLFEKAVDDVFNKVSESLVDCTRDLRTLYKVNDKLIAFRKNNLYELFEYTTKTPMLLLKLAFIYDNVEEFKNEAPIKKISMGNNPSNLVLNSANKILLNVVTQIQSTYTQNVLRSKFGKMVVVNPELDVAKGNRLVDIENNKNYFEENNSRTVHCKASGAEIIVSDYFQLPSNVVKHGDDYFYSAAYKHWKLANKFGCKIKMYDDKSVFDFKETAIENILKSQDTDEDFFKMYTQINNYTAKPSKMPYVNEDGTSRYFRDKLYLGVELEFDGGGRDHENNHLFLAGTTNYKPYMYSTSDSSLDNGFETKTVPSELSALMNKDLFNWDLGFSLLKERGYIAGASQTCGYHLHLSKKFFTTPLDKYVFDDNDLSKLGLAVLSIIIEKNWKKLVPFTRRSAGQLDRWAANRNLFNASDFKHMKEQLNYKTVYKTIKNIYDQYNSHSNAVNNSKGQTYELRIFKGSMSKIAVLATAQFASNLAYIVRDKMKDIVLSTTNRDNEALKTAFQSIMEVDFDDIVGYKSYDELNEYIEDYSRHAE